MVEKASIPPGLYIHIPFCGRKCLYCDFYSTDDVWLMDEYLRALSAEMELYRDKFTGFDTVYIGGGTPSLLSLAQVETLLGMVSRCFTIMPEAEITIEVNPADWSLEDLSNARKAGVNRISIGVQTFRDAELVLLGRRHTGDQALAVLADARAAGFDNMSLDLMYSLPGQTWEEWAGSLMQALRFRPEHISCYELEIKHDTPLGRRMLSGEIEAPSEESRTEFFIRTSEYLEGSGYVHYEISNFAAGMDRASRHNSKYWDHTPYLGLGPSAHSFHGTRRWWNHASLEGYLHDLDAGIPPVGGDEDLTPEQLCMEALFLAMRTQKGIDLEQLRDRYGYDLAAEKSAKLEKLMKEGLIEIFAGHIRPTRAGMAVADSLVLYPE